MSTQRASANFANLLAEPADHALGRSRGGLSTKIHQLADGHGRPLVLLIGPGQAGDAPMFPHVMAHLHRGLSAATADAAHRRGHPRTVGSARPPQTTRISRRAAGQLRPDRLPQPKRRRTRLLPGQTMARTGHPLRQARPDLPRRGRPARHRHLVASIRRHALLLFSGGSLGCAAAPGAGWLIAARALQAVGRVLMTPSSLSIVRHVFSDPAQRARAIGVWSMVFGAATACGPLVGGLLVDSLGWRSAFWVNLPIGALAWLLGRKVLPESQPSARVASTRPTAGGAVAGLDHRRRHSRPLAWLDQPADRGRRRHRRCAAGCDRRTGATTPARGSMWVP